MQIVGFLMMWLISVCLWPKGNVNNVKINKIYRKIDQTYPDLRVFVYFCVWVYNFVGQKSGSLDYVAWYLNMFCGYSGLIGQVSYFYINPIDSQSVFNTILYCRCVQLKIQTK